MTEAGVEQVATQITPLYGLLGPAELVWFGRAGGEVAGSVIRW